MSDNDTTATVEAQRTVEANDGSKAQYESSNAGVRQDVCTLYAIAQLADKLGEYATLTIDGDGDSFVFTGFSGGGDGNYAKFDSENGAVVGMYVHRDLLSEIGVEEEDLEDGGTIGVSFAPSDEESFEDAAEEMAPGDDEADALLN